MRPIPTRLLTVPIAAAAAAALAAGCGSGGSSSQGGSSTAATVSAKRISGVGTVLVDARGRVLYSPDQERSGRVTCAGACAAVWVPLTASGTPTAGAGVGRLGVVTRPGGARQVTVGGRPAYTFAQDGAGQATGQGAHDAFGGRSFTWHVLAATGAPAPAPQPATSGSGGGGYGGY